MSTPDHRPEILCADWLPATDSPPRIDEDGHVTVEGFDAEQLRAAMAQLGRTMTTVRAALAEAMPAFNLAMANIRAAGLFGPPAADDPEGQPQ